MSIRLYQCDCLDVLFEIVASVNNPVIVSDPPFNIGYHYKTYKDRKPEEKYFEWLGDIFSMCPSVVVHYPEALYKLSFQMGIFPQKVASWVYNSNTAKQHRDIAFFNVCPDFRQVVQPYKNPNDKRIKKLIASGKMGGRLYDWWNVNQVKNVSKVKTKHPCQMPVEVMKNIVGVLPKGITVIDPFMGSGTTGVACKELGYDFVGIELDESYFLMASERINNTLGAET